MTTSTSATRRQLLADEISEMQVLVADYLTYTELSDGQHDDEYDRETHVDKADALAERAIVVAQRVSEFLVPARTEDVGTLIGAIFGDAETADHVGGHFTCTEADRIAEALILLGRRWEAGIWLMGHAEHDDAGDGHFDLWGLLDKGELDPFDTDKLERHLERIEG